MDSAANHIATYQNGGAYRPPAGRQAPKANVADYLAPTLSVVTGKPGTEEFLRMIRRELKIRFFTQNTIKDYMNAVRRFLNWFGRLPHQATREDVREFLEVMVDGGASSSHVAGTLSAIRTAFDKLCCRQVTFGLATPRKPKRQPVVLNQTEIRLMLEAARCLRDKLLMSLMYGTGLRVSEVSRLQWQEIDFERLTLRVTLGKGRKDRLVILPESLVPLLRSVSATMNGRGYVFPAENGRCDRHLSPRTVQRAVQNAAGSAGVAKAVTPHSFRHSFATHLIEDGLDIRFIQKLLGHAKLETTTIYTKVAVLKDRKITSPLDQLQGSAESTEAPSAPKRAPVGTMKLELHPVCVPGETEVRQAEATITIENHNHAVELRGITLRESRPGWVAMDVPPEEEWAETLKALPAEQSDRIRSPEFLDYLRGLLGQRYLTMR